MKITEITLDRTQPLFFRGEEVARINKRDCQHLINCLAIRFLRNGELELPSAVDISERLDCPRIFVIQGKPSDTFLVFGGELLHWVTTDGTISKTMPLFRTTGNQEYWVTQIVERDNSMIVIYEAAVLVIDEALNVVFHKRKFFNDDFVSLEGNAIKFLRDHEDEWFMPLESDTGSNTGRGM
jgi:hypothetical protein